VLFILIVNYMLKAISLILMADGIEMVKSID